MTENPNIAQALRGLRETFEYMNTRYGPNTNGYWWAIAHRARLITTGQYIKTSEQTRLTIRWGNPSPLDGPRVISHAEPEVVNFRSGGTLHHHPTISLACFNRHYLCSGATYTHNRGWVTCQCDCHKENS